MGRGAHVTIAAATHRSTPELLNDIDVIHRSYLQLWKVWACGRSLPVALTDVVRAFAATDLPNQVQEGPFDSNRGHRRRLDEKQAREIAPDLLLACGACLWSLLVEPACGA